MALRVLLTPVVLAALVATPARAEQSIGTWADVQKIQAGQAVEVGRGDSDRLRGTLVSVAEAGLVVKVDGADSTVARATLLSVAVQRRSTTKGAVIGVVSGLAMAYPNTKLQGGRVAATGIVGSTLIGAWIGARHKHYRIAYRRDGR
jgi:hypothetical protein